MTICYLNHDLGGTTGAGRFYLSLIQSLKKIMPDLNYRALTHDDFLPTGGWRLFFLLPRLRRIFKDYEIIHALDGWPYGVIAAVAALGLRKKLIITAIGTGAVKPLYSFWKRPLLRWSYKQARVLTAVSNNTKKEILKVIPDLKIEVVNHGVAEKFRISGISEIPEIKKLKPYILSVGAWKPRKGFEYSIKAFEAVKAKFPNLKYVIVSNPPEEEVGKYDRVVFLNNVAEQELIALYRNAELFILLPYDADKDIEGFGLVFLEAAACGLPAVGTSGSSAEDAVLDGKNGTLVPPADFRSAAEAITRILSDRHRRADYSRQSLSFAAAMSWGEAARSYLAIYSRV